MFVTQLQCGCGQGRIALKERDYGACARPFESAAWREGDMESLPDRLNKTTREPERKHEFAQPDSIGGSRPHSTSNHLGAHRTLRPQAARRPRRIP
ncbi:hypothetical protein GNX71_17005 [Variovorax sp. RKNM96]|uniref:hypothetical protein n=1 Tax=Variovorax sp. RKNM96 TaxID=2681552 RepID=UPI00197DC0C3|nr:hypothetical protein [Variovorax sp. RKNM96]QSI31181.1 hypothetical protein GNX71_17005 [Variovorax sp. RKNM96]